MKMTPRRAGMGKAAHVADVLREAIRSGEYKPGDGLPSEPQLIEQFGYDRATIRRGLAQLRNEGLVTSEQGRGVFVRKMQLVRHELLRVLQAERRRHQERADSDLGLFEDGTGVVDGALECTWTYSHVSASENLAGAFGVPAGTDLLLRRYSFFVGGEPHQITYSYLLGEMTAGTELEDPRNEHAGQGVDTQLRSIGVEIDRVEVDIAGRMPTPDEAAELRMPPGTPLLVDQRRSVSGGSIVCVADTLTPADRVVYGLDLNLDEV